jgi:cell division protein ZipA
MTELRWILLVAGVLVIAGVYFFTRNRPEADKGSDAGGLFKREPVLGADSAVTPGAGQSGSDQHNEPFLPGENLGDDEADSARADPEKNMEPETLGDPEKIVTLRVSFSAESSVPGVALTELFKTHGLRFGRLKIFHKFQTDGSRNIGPIFSVASIAEPGSFDLANIETQNIPGVTLFMVLPNYLEGRLAFESMLDFARAVADSFDGEVLDETGSSLSIQRAGYLRDEIIDFERKRSIRSREY